jgi:hypothetical protein
MPVAVFEKGTEKIVLLGSHGFFRY